MGDETTGEDSPTTELDNVLPINERVAKALGNRHTRLRALVCFEDFHNMVLEGWAPATVASFIQDTCGELTDMRPKTLADAIYRYRADLPASLKVQQRNPAFVEKAARALQRGINELDEMARLYQTQRGRIDVEVQNEMDPEVLNGKLLDGTKDEIKTALEILQASAKLKQELGIDPRHLGKLDIDVTGGVVHAHAHAIGSAHGEETDPAVREVLEDPQARRRLLGLAAKIKTLAKDPETDKVFKDGEVIEAEVIESEPEATDEDES